VGPSGADRIRLDETTLSALELEPDGSLRIEARPHEIVSVRLKYADSSDT
jgi:hypothetical protein